MIHDQPLSWYVDKIANNEHFSLGMYGDGEWQCIFNHAFGDRFKGNCEGTEYTSDLSEKMADSLNFKGENFLFSAPDTFKKVPDYKRYEILIDKLAHKEYVEKNVWHKEMCNGNLYPLIKELRNHNVAIIGNKNLKGLTFLNYDKFFEVSYPNCYGELEKITNEILEYGKSGVYIFACGIPATLFVQAVHGKIPNSWFIDMGSIWDGFVGIGGQRPTRREFYKHPDQWKEWVDKNLKEIEWPRELPQVNWYGMGSLDVI